MKTLENLIDSRLYVRRIELLTLIEKRAEKLMRRKRTTERGAGLHAGITILSVARRDWSRKGRCLFMADIRSSWLSTA